MDKGAVGWLVKTVDAEYWKVSGFYDKSDLIQDGYLCYYRVANKYGKRSPAHTMALFKTAFRNHIIDLAAQRRRNLAVSLESDIGISLDGFEASEAQPFVWENAPELIQMLFDAVAAHPHRVRFAPKRYADGTREPTNVWLGRIMGGVELPRNFHLQLRAYIEARQ
jgi:hypothetical protein